MRSPSLTWRRIGVGVAALATVAAGSPLLLSTSANAVGSGAPFRLELTRVELPYTPVSEKGRTSAAAGTCTPYEYFSSNAQGGESLPATVTVTIAEDDASNTHDVDFCLVDGGTPYVNPPQYTNAANPPTAGNPTAPQGTTKRYNPGPSITTEPGESGTAPGANTTANQPDVASGAEPTAGDNRNNPTGEDSASFSTVNGIVRFGVAGLLPGQAATINAFVDPNANFSRDCDLFGDCDDNVLATERTLTFTAGGRPGTNAASDAVRSVQVTPKESFAAIGSSHTFDAVFYNVAGDVVGGVAFARIIATSGPNGPTGTSNGSFTGNCTPSGNEGEPSACTYTPQFAGTDTVTVFVNQTTGSPTFGLDTNEPRDTATAVTTAAPVSAAEARFLTLTPETATTPAGSSQQFVATVTGSTGAPANGVSVTFSENGPGILRGGTVSGESSSVTFVTGSAATATSGSGPAGPGRALAVLDTVAGQTGTNVVVATVTNPASTQCGQTTAPAGRCTDSSPVTITASAASPSPSASASGTASPRPSVSASATPTASISPRPTATSTQGTTCQVVPTVRLERSTIIATGSSGVTVTGAPNTIIDLFAYSRPSTTYRVVRSGDVGSDGVAEYRVTPPTNTRLYAQQRGCAPGPSVVLNVRTQISLNVVRNAVRTYTFSGSAIPARPNGLIVSLYRVTNDGRQILAAQTRANANVGQPGYDARRPAGSYSIRRVFTGTGRFGFVVRTGQDLQNAPGSSNVRSLLVF